MAAFFSSLGRTIIAGVVLVAILIVAAGTYNRMGEHGYWLFFMRWLHIGSGVMWIPCCRLATIARPRAGIALGAGQRGR
ncbi:MAG: hypothetical protein WDO13_20590 [Verrucomicrobiota bacterium]